MIPTNPLDIYHSYSYHFVIVAAASTEAIRNIVSGNGFLSNVHGAILGEEINDPKGKNSGCFLVVDTRKTSEFAIDSLHFDIYIANGAVPSDSVTLMTAISMHIVDPSGVGFFNYFKYLCDTKLQTDITGVTFLIHTMFIGHTDDGKTVPLPEYDLNVPAMMGETFSMNEFGPRGSTYDVNFYPINLGGIAFLSTYNQMFEMVPYKGTDNLLGNIIQSFETELNKRAANWYRHFNPSATTTDSTPTKNATGRLVQYMITIPDEWFYFTVDGIRENIIEINWKELQLDKQKVVNDNNAAAVAEEKKSNQPTATYHSINIDMTIEDGLNSIFMACPKVAAMANKERKEDGSVKLFKTLTSLTSDDETVTVHFDVVAFDLPNVDKVRKATEKANNVDNHPTRKNADSYINDNNAMIFEYVFSGLDNDVLDFQIKVNNLYVGLFSYMKVAQLASQAITDNDQKRKNDDGNVIDKEPYGIIAKYQPLVPPPKSNQAIEDFQVPNYMDPNAKKKLEDLQEFHKALSDIHVTSMETNIKIRGNPQVLKRYSIGELPQHFRPAGKLNDYVNLFTSGNEANLAKATGWEYKGGGVIAAASGATISDAHKQHRTGFVDKIVKAINQNVDKLNKSATNPDKNTPDSSFVAAGTWAKVNVYAPKDYPFAQQTDSEGHLVAQQTDSEGHLVQGTLGTNAFRTQLFYDSWYLVSKVSNSFEHGNFSQTLNLLAMDTYGKFGQANQTKVGKDVNAGSSIAQEKPI